METIEDHQENSVLFEHAYHDTGWQTVLARLDRAYLNFSLCVGNDPTTLMPEYGVLDSIHKKMNLCPSR